MKKEDIQKMPDYFDRYINLSDDLDYIQVLEISLKELENAPVEKWKALGEKVYAPGKWTVKDLLQHCIDTERVFTYRITAIARGDKQQMLPFEEDDYAKNALANRRSVDDLMEEAILLRKATLAMFKSFTLEMLHQVGRGFNGEEYCPLSLAFMLGGHQRWHLGILEERYYPLIN